MINSWTSFPLARVERRSARMFANQRWSWPPSGCGRLVGESDTILLTGRTVGHNATMMSEDHPAPERWEADAENPYRDQAGPCAGQPPESRDRDNLPLLYHDRSFWGMTVTQF